MTDKTVLYLFHFQFNSIEIKMDFNMQLNDLFFEHCGVNVITRREFLFLNFFLSVPLLYLIRNKYLFPLFARSLCQALRLCQLLIFSWEHRDFVQLHGKCMCQSVCVVTVFFYFRLRNGRQK